jgi:hypothetical protein
VGPAPKRTVAIAALAVLRPARARARRSRRRAAATSSAPRRRPVRQAPSGPHRQGSARSAKRDISLPRVAHGRTVTREDNERVGFGPPRRGPGPAGPSAVPRMGAIAQGGASTSKRDHRRTPAPVAHGARAQLRRVTPTVCLAARSDETLWGAPALGALRRPADCATSPWALTARAVGSTLASRPYVRAEGLPWRCWIGCIARAPTGH